GGRLSNLTGSGKSYTATFTGAAETHITNAFVSVTAGSWQEDSGNPGTGGSSALFQVDTLTPAPPPAGTTADMILRGANSAPTVAGQYEIYDIGSNAILAGYSLGQVGSDGSLQGSAVSSAVTPPTCCCAAPARAASRSMTSVTTTSPVPPFSGRSAWIGNP